MDKINFCAATLENGGHIPYRKKYLFEFEFHYLANDQFAKF